jgi:aquaglyceroporin related protein, other eukaryote
MVAPFLGCLFGGWLYDTFLFTGDSPINTPWMGLERVIKPTRARWSSGEYNIVRRDPESAA